MIDKQANTRNGRFYEFNHVDFFFLRQSHANWNVAHENEISVNSSIHDKIRILCARRSGHEKHFRFAVLAHFVRNNQPNVVQTNLFRLCVSMRVHA